jgi:hypothetical protein
MNMLLLALLPHLLLLALTGHQTAAAEGDVDWLLAAHDPVATGYVSELTKTDSAGRAGLTLSNGLVSRSFITEPNFATVDLRRLD